MSQKKLMLLGGLRYLLPVIEAAHKLGCYVITCDYLPDNIAHKYSDEYVNVSIVDKEAVLSEARKRKIDGIMSFAVDPGVVTAAYVADKMGLPMPGPYESVCILQNKDRFRKFLADNGFNVPKAKGYASKKEALSDIGELSLPVIVKPTDSAGSKGVTKVNAPDELEAAVEIAFEHSISGHIIIEDFIEKQGCSSDCDCFSIDGRLEFVSFSAQRFDVMAPNPYTPAAFSWPSTFTKRQEAELKSELQRLLTLLGMRTSVYNIETRIGTDGKPYIMEVSPRGGGNRLSEMIRYITGMDLITAAIQAAVGENPSNIKQKTYHGHWAEIILHSDQGGFFERLELSPLIDKYIVEKDIWVNHGDSISPFSGANCSLGSLVIKFPSIKDLQQSFAALDAGEPLFKIICI